MNTSTLHVWNTEQLIHFSHAWASAFGTDVSPKPSGDRWTTQSWITMSQSLGGSYGLGMN